jgi:hypothetical protein
VPRDTYSEAWRHECEINFVLRMPTRERSAAYLALVERHRGKAAADRMEEELTRAWNERKTAGSGGV